MYNRNIRESILSGGNLLRNRNRPTARLSITGQLFFFAALALIAMISLILFYNVTFSHLPTRRANAYFDVYMQQLSGQIESVLGQTENYAKTLTTSKNIQSFVSAETNYDRYMSVTPAVNSLDTILQSFPLLQDIQVLRYDGSSINSSLSYTSTWSKRMFDRIVDQYRLKETPVKKGFYTDMIADEDRVSFAYVSPIFSTRTNTLSNNNIGVLIFLCRIDSFVELISGMHSVPSATFVFSAGEHQTFSAEKSEDLVKIGRHVAALPFSGRESVSFRYDQKRYLSGCEPIRNTDWNIFYWIDVDELTSDMRQMQRYALTGTAVFACVLVLLCFSLYLQITRPVRTIALNLAALNTPEDRLKPMITPKNELRAIYNSVNTMLDHMQAVTQESKRVTDKLYQAEMAAKYAELAYYQKQINPHFLYNSLECIRSMAIGGATDSIEAFTQSLANIFRYAVSSVPYVPFEQEMACINDYFHVMSMRFPGRFQMTTKIEIDPGVETMKMILQPLFENCLTHAYDAQHTRIQIQLSACYLDGCVHIRLADNGRGIAPDVLKEILAQLRQDDLPEENFHHFGLINVHRRLVLNYGKQHGLRIRSAFGHYTSVAFSFPLR